MFAENGEKGAWKMSEKLHVGSAWEEATANDPTKRYFRVAVDLGGLVPPIHCRIAENSKPKSERSPSHLMFFSPVDGEGRVVGAFWTRTSEEAGTTYLMGRITPSRFGMVEIKGGAKLDLRLAGGALNVKLVAAKPAPDAEGKNRPTHYLLRTTPRGRKAAAEAIVPGVEEPVEDEVVEEEEIQEEQVA
jgi:uncharacterized protein (DUF736 family)